jgi:hypothetical protein
MVVHVDFSNPGNKKYGRLEGFEQQSIAILNDTIGEEPRSLGLDLL